MNHYIPFSLCTSHIVHQIRNGEKHAPDVSQLLCFGAIRVPIYNILQKKAAVRQQLKSNAGSEKRYWDQGPGITYPKR